MRTLAQLSSLGQRAILVAGGAGHLGRVLCETFEELGATVGVADLQPSSNSSRWYRQVDLACEDDAHETVGAFVAAHGRLDVLVYCAAFVGTSRLPGWAVPLEQQSAAGWDAGLRVNVTGAFSMAQAARDALARSRGAVLLVSSTHGVVAPDPRLYAGTTMTSPAAYGASKAALVQLARYLAAAYAPEVRVNVLSPGGIWRSQPEAFVTRYEDRTPLRRMAREEDLKGAAAFLASDLSSYVTGHNLIVDGGWTVW